MATKSLTVTEDAYSRLKKLKKGNESFSDVIKRITGGKRLSEAAGTLKDGEEKELREEIVKLREEMDRELEEDAG